MLKTPPPPIASYTTPFHPSSGVAPASPLSIGNDDWVQLPEVATNALPVVARQRAPPHPTEAERRPVGDAGSDLNGYVNSPPRTQIEKPVTSDVGGPYAPTCHPSSPIMSASSKS